MRRLAVLILLWWQPLWAQGLTRSFRCLPPLKLNHFRRAIWHNSMAASVDWSAFDNLAEADSDGLSLDYNLLGYLERATLNLRQEGESQSIGLTSLTVSPDAAARLSRSLAIESRRIEDQTLRHLLNLNRDYSMLVTSLADDESTPQSLAARFREQNAELGPVILNQQVIQVMIEVFAAKMGRPDFPITSWPEFERKVSDKHPYYRLLQSGVFVFIAERAAFILARDESHLAVCPRADKESQPSEMKALFREFLSSERVREVLSCEALLVR